MESKYPLIVLCCWVVALIVYYNIHDDEEVAPLYVPTAYLVNAVVFIAMGNMAGDPMVDYSIASVRKLGKWRGDIYVVTDREECFDDAVTQHGVVPIKVPPAKSIIEIKSLKTRLMKLLPKRITGVLYMDVDIVVTKSLAFFFKDLGSIVYKRQVDYGLDQLNRTDSRHNETMFDMGAFLDAKGHYVGFCAGCDKWHTGVIWMRRGFGEKCLAAWERVLLSGRYNTDQESLDEAEREGSCPHALAFPSRHLLFAKDYLNMVFTSGQTFIHMTAAGRLESQDIFYSNVVVPRLRNSLHPPLDPSIFNQPKQCRAATVPVLTAPQDATAKDAANDPAKGTAKDAAKDAAKDIAKENGRDSARESAKGRGKESAKDTVPSKDSVADAGTAAAATKTAPVSTV